jgi:signal transduction histidine kinase
MGFRSVFAFSTGEELLENLNQQPDLIFLDYYLGNYIGLDLLKQIKSMHPGIHVVIISGQEDMETTIRLMQNGAFDYIIKNEAETERLNEVIEKFLTAREHKEKLESLTSNDPSGNYLSVIMEAQQKVRKEISNELHDNVSQILSVSNLFLESASIDEINRVSFIKESQTHLSNAISEIRKLSHSLHSSFLHSIDLQHELLKLFSSFRKQLHIQLIDDIDLSTGKDAISPEIQHSLLRIIQEQLNNIVKYARATKIDIRLYNSENQLHLTVSDNGIGFDLNQSKKGIGLTNISNRVYLMGGTYLINTEPGNGCKWSIRIPIENNNDLKSKAI